MNMRLLDTMVTAAKNVLFAGTRTALCVLSICIGITSVSTVMGLGNAAGDSIQKELDRIGVRGIAFYQPSGGAIPAEAVMAVQQADGIAAAMPLSLTAGSVQLRNISSSAGILGVDSNLDRVFQITVIHGSLPSEEQVRSRNKIAVIDEELALRAYKRTNIIGKQLSVTVNGVTEKMEICGVIQSQSASLSMLLGGQLPYLVYIPYTVLQEMSPDIQADKLITSAEGEDPESVAAAVIEQLKRKLGIDCRFENLNRYLGSFTLITNVLTVFISGIAVISVVVGGIGVMNAMVSSVEVRTREIGIYRALGAQKRDILRAFLAESMLLCLCGGACGITLSWCLFQLLQALFSVHILFRWKTIFISLCISASCGALFGFLPALRAARLDPIQTIRSE